MILLCGFPKTGNTWLKFIICNYVSILFHGAKFTLTYEQLNDIFKHPISLHHTHLPFSGKMIYGSVKNVPEYYSKFDKIIYIFRNPYDTMISFWHYLKNRNPPFNLLRNNFNLEMIEHFSELKGFVKYFLPLYIDHIKSTKNKADLILSYDKLRKDPNDFKKAIKMIFNEVDEEAFKKTIEMSSFDNIRNMGIETNQKHGLAKDYLGHFCRNGKSGQYKEIMSENLIQYIKNEWDKITF